MKKPVVIHSYFFALFPVISLYAANIDQVSVKIAMGAMAGGTVCGLGTFQSAKTCAQ